MRSMQWQLGELETISAFAFMQRETKKNLCRGGRSQDLPNTDFIWYHVLNMQYISLLPKHNSNNNNNNNNTKQLVQTISRKKF